MLARTRSSWNPPAALWERGVVQPRRKPARQVFDRFHTESPGDPAPYPEEWEAYVLTKTCALPTAARK